jgi:hypothetical protein
MRHSVIVTTTAAVALVGLNAAPALARSGRIIENGKNAPVCTDIGSDVECSGKVAGLAGTAFRIEVDAVATLAIECTNPGGEIAPGDLRIDASGDTGELTTPRNRQSLFTVTGDADLGTPQDWSSSCPNPMWTPVPTEVSYTEATLSLYDGGVLADTVTVPVN